MADQPLSLRAYAAHRKGLGLAGGSLQAVQRAISAGRLRDSLVVVDGVKKIADPELADREWAANTDLTRAASAGDEPQDDESPEGTFAYWKAKKMELDFRKASSELVNAEDAAAGYAELCSTARTKLLGLPSKVKQKHPEVSLAVLATIDEEVREGLEELARGQTE